MRFKCRHDIVAHVFGFKATAAAIGCETRQYPFLRFSFRIFEEVGPTFSAFDLRQFAGEDTGQQKGFGKIRLDVGQRFCLNTSLSGMDLGEDRAESWCVRRQICWVAVN